MSAIAAPDRSVDSGRTGRNRARSRMAGAAWFASPFVVLIALWAVVIPVADVSERTFPTVASVASAFFDSAGSGELWKQAAASLGRVLAGAVIAVVVGVPFGILMGVSKGVATFFSPLLRFSVALAGIAWVPVATLWLGYSNRAVIFIVFNAVFFAIVYNTMLGVRQIDGSLLRAARSLGASRPRMLWEVYLPGAAPSIATGVRVGMGFAWRGLIAAEMIATSTGLGYSLFLARQYYETDVIVLMMIVIGVLWLAMDRFMLQPFERRTVERWGRSGRVAG